MLDCVMTDCDRGETPCACLKVKGPDCVRWTNLKGDDVGELGVDDTDFGVSDGERREFMSIASDRKPTWWCRYCDLLQSLQTIPQD